MPRKNHTSGSKKKSARAKNERNDKKYKLNKYETRDGIGQNKKGGFKKNKVHLTLKPQAKATRQNKYTGRLF